jgi:hypothetical protein
MRLLRAKIKNSMVLLLREESSSNPVAEIHPAPDSNQLFNAEQLNFKFYEEVQKVSQS